LAIFANNYGAGGPQPTTHMHTITKQTHKYLQIKKKCLQTKKPRQKLAANSHSKNDH